MPRLILLLILFVAGALPAFSQGCSDAGFCTMGAMKPDQPYNKKLAVKLRTIEFSQYYGHTHFNNKIYVSTLEANVGIGDKYVVQVKVPYLTTHGHLGTFNGLSDLSFSVTRNVLSREHFDVNLTVGTKIPTNNGNQQRQGDFTLPMYYQTSLGTYDLVVGASVINRKWLFAIGYQQALTRNKNEFWAGEWSGSEDFDYIKQYQSSIHLKRGKDFMMRVERNFRLSRFNASIGLLPIYRFTKDVRADVETFEDTGEIKDVKANGTDGLALSGIYTLGYNFNVKSGVKLLVGNRFLRRDFNPDGLSREFVSSLTYTYRF